MAEQAIYYDSSLCTACKGCQVACKCWNNLPSPTELNANQFTGTYQNPPDLNENTRIIMTFNEMEGGSKGVMWAFGRRACQHCSDAPCASVCPANAIHKDEASGMVTLDRDLCIGCQYCSIACPFDVPRYTKVEDGLKTQVNKCTGCVDRIEQGLVSRMRHHLPARRPQVRTPATRWSPWPTSASRPSRRAASRTPCVYGENEMGGLHVIQVLKYGVEAHGQVVDPKVSPLVEHHQAHEADHRRRLGRGAARLRRHVRPRLGLQARRPASTTPRRATPCRVNTGEVLKHGDGFDDESVKDHIVDAVKGFSQEGGQR